MRSWEKKYIIKNSNMILETNYLWGEKIKTLSEDHIRYVLGIELPLNESYYSNPKLIQTIIAEQMLYEDFIKSVKDFAKEKINAAVDKIRDWKEMAAFVFKVIKDPQLLQNFTINFWKTFQQGPLKELEKFLQKIQLQGIFDSIKKVIDFITKLTGFKKFLAATAFASITKYIVDKLKSLPINKINEFISQYLSETFIGDIIAKLTDFTSYLGILQPIIKTTEFIFKVLQPTIDKFKNVFSQTTAPNLSPQPAT